METGARQPADPRAERAGPEEVRRQGGLFGDAGPFRVLVDAVPAALAVLNRQRQVVFHNRTLLEFAGEVAALGLRLGELVGCVHAAEECGCGTTAFCEACGAADAIRTGQAGEPAVRECRILLRECGEALDLRVRAVPLVLDGERFTALSLADVSHEKRRQALERIFFHDVLNTAGNVRGVVQLLRTVPPEEQTRFLELLGPLAEQLIEEIEAQRQLAAAESHDLTVRREVVDPGRLVAEVADGLRRRRAGPGPEVRVEPAAPAPPFVTDATLLRRVLTNMLKNAVEASTAADRVTIGFAAGDDAVEFRVHNPAVLPREVQLQLFQRSFSTKGEGRGLGTYSMKLLAERYLGGAVSFATDEAGTTFRARFPRTPPGEAQPRGRPVA